MLITTGPVWNALNELVERSIRLSYKPILVSITSHLAKEICDKGLSRNE
jgi:hypothetical protein